MKVLLSWMQRFAPIEGDPDDLAAALTELGLVVEDVTTVGNEWSGIVVAKVMGLRPHPEADRIQLVDVDTGGVASEAGEPLQICCGAFNMAVGDLVPLATLGTVMPGGLEIARRKLRGEWSNGMICSAPELALDGDSDGIMVLDPDLAVGEPLADALGSETDVLFDIDVEGNRPDALSVAGVARDLAAKLGVPFAFPISTTDEASAIAADLASVDIQDTTLCLRFGVRVLENVTVGSSPSWLVSRLDAAGMRSINSIVDISNYVMLELGQPNHTYDLDLVPEGLLRVRMGRDGESLTTLDDQDRSLTAADGLICNQSDEPIGLAGVMGGASTEISDATTRVLLEAAVWDRMTIAKTSRRLNLRSEASTRFERGVDPFGIERALDRFAELAVELCGATVAAGHVVVDGGYAPTPPVRVRTAKVNHLLNTDLTSSDISGYLDPIGFDSSADPEAEDALLVTVPSWRPDSSIEEDIVEEVGRHHGYEKSGKRVPTPAQNGELTPHQQGRRAIRRAMIGAGFSEAMPLPFLAPDDLARAGLPDIGISLQNPLVAEESILRTSLLPGLLKAVGFNQSHRNEGVRLFEIGNVFLPAEGELPDEQEWLGAVLAGQSAIEATQLLVSLADVLRLKGLKIENNERPGLHPTRSATAVFRGRDFGEVGEVDPGVLEAYGVSGRVGWLQLNTAPIVEALGSNPKYSQVSLFPSSDVDLAFIVPIDVPVNELMGTIQKTGGDLLRSARFLNAFRSEQLGSDVRSLAFGLRFQADDRTLTDSEVADLRQSIIDAVVNKNSATFRL